MHISRWVRSVLLIAALLGVAAACGDDDGDGVTSSGEASASSGSASGSESGSEGGSGSESGADVEAYCDATARIETVGEPDVDFETATEEEVAEAAKAFASDTLRPIADDIVAAAPEEVADDIALLSAAVDELAETGDFEAAFENDEVEAASDRTHAFDLENCGWQKVDVTAVDYAFQGLGDAEAGIVSFEFSNEGEEPHEFVLFRKNDGVTESAQELLANEEESEDKVTFVAGTFAEPGDNDYAVADLEPGNYAAVCFVPVGGGEEGPPHYTEGMVSEFSVE